jgi:hypothetical protein
VNFIIKKFEFLFLLKMSEIYFSEEFSYIFFKKIIVILVFCFFEKEQLFEECLSEFEKKLIRFE